MYKYAKFDQNILAMAVQGFSLKDLDQSDRCSAKSRHRFAYQWLDNVKMYKKAKCDPNIPVGSRVMSIFTN